MLAVGKTVSIGVCESWGNSVDQECLALSWGLENHKVGSGVMTGKRFILFLPLCPLD